MQEFHTIIEQTQCWLDNIIIGHNICPFAKRERDRKSIRFYVDENTKINQVLENLVLECERLDREADIETTLFILGKIGQNFDDFLDFLDLANQLLIAQGYEGVYQLASFHPDYCFAESSEEDPANYTNRSPYAMLHLIREQSLEKALQSYPNPDLIPEHNIEFCRNQGLEKMQQMLTQCMGNRRG